MSRYSSEGYRWRRGSGGGSHSSDHSRHHWSSSDHSSHGFSHQPPLLPDPYGGFEQQPSWSSNQLMQWIPQESWGWQQIPQAAGFGPPGSSGFLKPNPKSMINQPKHHQFSHQNKQKSSPDLKLNRKPQLQPNYLPQQHNKQQVQQYQNSKKQLQPNSKKQQQQSPQHKVSSEKKLEQSSCSERNEDQPNASPPLGSEEARRKALASTADKLRRCLSSMGQERTEVLETLLDEPSSVIDKSGTVTQKDGLSKGLSSLQPVPPSEREIQLSAADWRHIGLSSQKSANKDEDDVVFVSAPAPEMVAIEDSSDEESEQEKAATPVACTEMKEAISSETCKVKPSFSPPTTEASEQDVNLDNIENFETGKEDRTLKLTETDCNLDENLSHQKISLGATVSSKVDTLDTAATESVGNGLCVSKFLECSETEEVKETKLENVCLVKKELVLSESVNKEVLNESYEVPGVESAAVTQLHDQDAAPVQCLKVAAPAQCLPNVAPIQCLPNVAPIQCLQDSTLAPCSQKIPESSFLLSSQSTIHETNLESSVPLTKTIKNIGGTVEALKRNVMQKLLDMGAAGVRNLVDNPTQSRRVQHALRHLVNEHRTAWTRHMRRMAEVRFRRDCNSTVQSADLGTAPDLDADAAVDLASLPPELIERLGDLLQLDGMGAITECSDVGVNDSGLEELQELQEALSRQVNAADVSNQELSDLTSETKKEIGDLKLEIEEEMDTFNTAAVLDSERDDTIPAESSSSVAPATEFGSLFCDFPDFSNDLDHASTSSPSLAVNENMDAAFQVSEQAQETSPAVSGDLPDLAASTNTGGDADLHTGNSSQSMELCQITSNAMRYLEEPLMEDMNSSSLSESLHSTGETMPQSSISKQLIASDASATAASGVQTEDSSSGENNDTTIAMNDNNNTNKSYKKVSHIRTLAARKEYKTNESPVDSETQTDIVDEPDLFLEVLHKKFSVPVDVLTALRKYINSSKNIADEDHIPQESVLESSSVNSSTISCAAGHSRVSPLPKSSHLSSTAHRHCNSRESTPCISNTLLVTNPGITCKNKTNIASNPKRRKPFHRDLCNVNNSNVLNASTSETGDTCKCIPPYGTTLEYDCPTSTLGTKDTGSLDCVANHYTTGENSSLIGPAVLSQFQEISCNSSEVGLVSNQNSIELVPLHLGSSPDIHESSNTGYITNASSYILQQMFDIDSKVSVLMKQKLELYQQLQGIFNSSSTHTFLSKRTKKANKMKRIRQRKEASRKLYREQQKMMIEKRRRESNRSVTSSTVLEDNMNSMPILENAIMNVTVSQSVLSSQTIPVLHREETDVRKEQNSLSSCSEDSQVGLKETFRSVVDIPVTTKVNDNQSFCVKESIVQRSQTVLSTNEVDSQIMLQSLSSEEDTSLSFSDNLTEGINICAKENSQEIDLNQGLNIELLQTPLHSVSPEKDGLQNSTLEALDSVACEYLSQRVKSGESQSEMEYSCPDKADFVLQTSYKDKCSIENLFPRKPVVRLTDITKNINEQEDEMTFDNVSKQSSAQADHTETSGDTVEENISKRDDLIGEVLQEKDSHTRTNRNKRRKGRALWFSKDSSSKKRKQSVDATTSTSGDSNQKTVEEDTDDCPILHLECPDFESNTATQRTLSTPKPVVNELESTSNAQENASSNIRSTRRKRPYSESVSHESSENFAADLTKGRNKRQRRRNATELTKTIPIELDALLSTSLKKTEKESSATGRSLKKLQPLQNKDYEKSTQKKEDDYKTPNVNEDVEEENRHTKRIRNCSLVVSFPDNQSHSSKCVSLNHDIPQEKEENLNATAVPHKSASSTKRSNAKSKRRGKSIAVQPQVVKDNEQSAQERDLVEITTSPELSSTVNTNCIKKSLDVETPPRKTECGETSLKNDPVEITSPPKLSSTKRTGAKSKSRRKSTDGETKGLKIDQEKTPQKADTVEMNSSSEFSHSKRSASKQKPRGKSLDVEAKVLKTPDEQTPHKADVVEINSSPILPNIKRSTAISKVRGKLLDVENKLQSSDEKPPQKADGVEINISPELPYSKRSTGKSKARGKSLDRENKDLKPVEGAVPQKAGTLEISSPTELLFAERPKTKTRGKSFDVENKDLKPVEGAVPQKAGTLEMSSPTESLFAERPKTKTRGKSFDVENKVPNSDQIPQKAHILETSSFSETSFTKKPTAKSKARRNSMDVVTNLLKTDDKHTLQKCEITTSPELLIKRSNAKSKVRRKSMDMGTKEQQADDESAEMLCNLDLLSTKKANVKSKTRGKSILIEMAKTDGEQLVQSADMFETVSPGSTFNTRAGIKSKATRKSMDMENKWNKTDSEQISQNTDVIERTSSPELVSDSDTEPLSSFTKTGKHKPRPKKKGAQIKAAPVLQGDCFVGTSSDGEREDRSVLPDDVLPGRVTVESSLSEVGKKEKEEAPFVVRNHSVTSKSWRMRAVAQMRQCEVKLHRLTEVEILALTARSPSTDDSVASGESERDVVDDLEITPPLSSSCGAIVLDDEDACSTISQSDTVSGGGTPAHDNETASDLRRMHLILVGHSGAILDLVTVGRQAVAASEDGFVYCYSLKTGRLKRAVPCGTQAITCLCTVDTEEGQLIFAGSLDGCLRCFTFKSGDHIFDAVTVGVPIQCIDHNWGNIYMGNRDGTVAVFNIQSCQLDDPRLACAEEPILSLKTAKEGPRQVIIVGCRNQPLSIRDAKTGLLMRTLDLQTSGAIYCMLLDASSVYCGTNTGKISVYEFTSGNEICRFTAGVGVVVCLRIYRNLLFAGCYDGFIYVFNLLDKTPVTRIPGPGKMIFCLEIVKNRVIAASKLNNRLEAWSFPSEIRKFFREIKHR